MWHFGLFPNFRIIGQYCTLAEQQSTAPPAHGKGLLSWSFICKFLLLQVLKRQKAAMAWGLQPLQYLSQWVNGTLVCRAQSCKVTSACASCMLISTLFCAQLPGWREALWHCSPNTLCSFGSTPWGTRHLKAQKIPRTSVYPRVTKQGASVPSAGRYTETGITQHLESSY